jgi:hypothetical protein
MFEAIVLQLPEGLDFYHKTGFEKLIFFNHKTVFGTRNPAFWVAAVTSSFSH